MRIFSKRRAGARAESRADGCLGIPVRVRLVSEEEAKQLVARSAAVRHQHVERKWFLVGLGQQEGADGARRTV